MGAPFAARGGVAQVTVNMVDPGIIFISGSFSINQLKILPGTGQVRFFPFGKFPLGFESHPLYFRTHFEVIDKLCKYFKCTVNDILEFKQK